MLKRLKKFVQAQTLLKDTDSLHIGDLIEIDRTIFSDWALYVGHNEVAHISGIDEDIPDGQAVVEICELTAVAEDHLVRVNNKEVPAKERNVTPLPVNVIMNTVTKLNGKTVPFNLMTRNYEHFVTEWKYGTGWSDQATTAISAMTMFSKPIKDPERAHNAMLTGITTILESPANSP